MMMKGYKTVSKKDFLPQTERKTAPPPREKAVAYFVGKEQKNTKRELIFCCQIRF